MTQIASKYLLTSLVTAGVALLFSTSAVAAVDAAAAKKLARMDSCLRCHAVAKKKEGPAYQAIAYKYKGNPDAVDTLFKHLTSGAKVKLSDGHEETHKVAKANNDDEIKNLIGWILAQ